MPTKTKPATKKRILSVKIKRMIDESPDTSHLGEYSNRATSEFSIDRAHSEDCASVVPIDKDVQRILINARAYVADLQSKETYVQGEANEEWEALEEAYYLLDHLAEGYYSCDCGGDRCSPREYRYFNPSFNYVDKNGKALDTPENVRKYTRQDYERMESLNAGHWCYIGIRAEAEVQVSDVIQHITSGGLWGIESDSERSYLESVQDEELANLKSELLALGFSRRAISQAFKSVEEVSE